ncbi:MAG: hypothetical protein L6R40_002307 [Gallowayella cf. fulva]|nr:MAG: hypothetical protein L6R40_002307 [Xanthomendoza cf. fulva]
MTLPETSRLAIAELVFYLPAFILSVIIVIRHGFNRQLGWIFLSILAILRLIGNSEEIAANQKSSNSLFIAAAVLNGLGLGPLLLAMVGLLKRIHQAVLQDQVNNKESLLHRTSAGFLNWARLLLLVALILAAVGNVKLYGSDQSEHSQGETLARAGTIIILGLFLGLVVITAALAAHTFLRQSRVKVGERRILSAVVASTPFIAVRLIYSLLRYFDTSSSIFTLRGGNIFVRAFMSVLEEWITVILYLAAGLLAPPTASDGVEASETGKAYDLNKSEPTYDPGRRGHPSRQIQAVA